MSSAVPSSEQVTAYLAAHKLEPVIEDAVNDAVLKQVKVKGNAVSSFCMLSAAACVMIILCPPTESISTYC